MKHYTEIRKTDFDLLWHACFVVPGSNPPRIGYDRVTEDCAMQLARRIGPQPRRIPCRKTK